MENNFPENKGINNNNEMEGKSLDWLNGMLSHYVGHFLLGSRVGESGYHSEALEKSKEVINKIKEKVNNPELISKLDELYAELEKVNLQSSEVDKNLLNSIDKAEDEVENIIRKKEIK